MGGAITGDLPFLMQNKSPDTGLRLRRSTNQVPAYAIWISLISECVHNKVNMNPCTKFHQNPSIFVKVMGL